MPTHSPETSERLAILRGNRPDIMSSMHRTIAGDILVQHLAQDALTIDPALLAQRGRSGRTLVKEGPLRLTIMALAPGGDLPPHSADEPVSIHILEGELSFFALDRAYPLRTGDVLVFAAGVEHAARSSGGAVFLLTVVHNPPADAAAAPGAVPRHAISESARQLWMDAGGQQTGAATPLG